MKNKEMINVLSFKGILTVNNTEEAKEILKKLIDMGFTFEDDTAYVRHSSSKYGSTYTNVNTQDLANEEILWSFNFVGGGFNSVTAKTLEEAITKASKEFSRWTIQPGSFKAHRTKESQDAYYNSLPLMD